jgi:hypothetical protein
MVKPEQKLSKFRLRQVLLRSIGGRLPFLYSCFFKSMIRSQRKGSATPNGQADFWCEADEVRNNLCPQELKIADFSS